MRMATFARLVLGALLLSCLHVMPAAAQATRTWVSGVGDDANPCSRTAPCKTFAGAISKTAAGGTITVLDPGGYGALTITKAISIQTDPGMGSIISAGIHGIIVNAGPTDEVFINGLIIDGVGTGLTGVRVLAGKSLTLTDCAVRGIDGSPGVGVEVAPSASAVAVVVSNCTLTGNRIGVRLLPTGSGGANVTLDRVVIDRNTAAGIASNGAASTVFLSNSVVTNNGQGLKVLTNGKIVSLGNNVIAANGTDGAPTSTIPLK